MVQMRYVYNSNDCSGHRNHAKHRDCCDCTGSQASACRVVAAAVGEREALGRVCHLNSLRLSSMLCVENVAVARVVPNLAAWIILLLGRKLGQKQHPERRVRSEHLVARRAWPWAVGALDLIGLRPSERPH